MPTLLIATGNPGKLAEYRYLLEGAGYRLLCPADLNMAKPAEESGSTYEENASLKARAYSSAAGLLTLADDSGLEVDALGGAPGIYSARFGGAGASDQDRIAALLTRLRDVPDEQRTAHFMCVIAIASPEGDVELCHGECHGTIATEPRGDNGFGYDPVFYMPSLGRTMAELPSDLKNRVSHRAMASREAARVLQRLIDSPQAR